MISQNHNLAMFPIAWQTIVVVPVLVHKETFCSLDTFLGPKERKFRTKVM